MAATNATIYSDAAACHKNALFFGDIPGAYAIAICFVLSGSVVSQRLTDRLACITPGVYSDGKKDEPASTSSTAPDAETHSPSLDEEQPPPYQPSQATTTVIASETSGSKPKVKRSSAHLFVVGSLLLLLNAIMLFFYSLSIQYMIFCREDEEDKIDSDHWWSRWGPIMLWTAIGITTLTGTRALMCWLILLRNLWGPGMAEKYPINSGAVFWGIFYVIISPFWLFCLLRQAAAKGASAIVEQLAKVVESCQRHLCPGALEEVDGQEARAVLLEDKIRGLDGHIREVSNVEDEQKEGLMFGMEK